MSDREKAALVTKIGIRRMLAAAVVATLAIATLGAVLIYRVTTIQQFREQAHANCESLEQLKGAIALVLHDSLVTRERNPDLSAAQLAAIRAYYQTQLNRFAPADCPNP